MHRRTFAANLLATTGALPVAGCLSRSTDTSGAESDGQHRGTDTATAVANRSDRVATEFRVTGVPFPDDPGHRATVSFDAAGNQVVVEGRVMVSCQTVELGEVAYDPDRRRLGVTVVVEQTDRAKNGTVECGQGAKEYRLVATVDGPLPDTVRVTHRDDYPDGQGLEQTVSRSRTASPAADGAAASEATRRGASGRGTTDRETTP